MLKVLRKKLILSIAASLVIVMTLTSTTFAWFAKNREAWIDNFELEIENYDGLWISVDGTHFSQSVTTSELKRAIIAKRDNKEYNDSSLDAEYVNDEYSKLRFKDITTRDLKNFYTVNQNSQTDGYYNFMEASKDNYVKFDLYFMLEPFGEGNLEYDLKFVNDTVVNDLEVGLPYIESGEVKTKSVTSFEVLNLLNGATIQYSYGNELSFDPANAMRISAVNETENKVNVYEPNMGLSSYAIKDGEGIFDPKANLAYQYLNAYARYDLPVLEQKETDIYDFKMTHKSFNDDVSLGTFKNTNGEYNVIKLEMSIWLEGYDGDYIAGASLKPIRCYLSFYKKEKVEEVV